VECFWIVWLPEGAARTWVDLLFDLQSFVGIMVNVRKNGRILFSVGCQVRFRIQMGMDRLYLTFDFLSLV